jgi:hypothetical protein
MRVKNKYRRVSDLPSDVLKRLRDSEALSKIAYGVGEAPLGTEFTVYGIMVTNGNVFYALPNYPRGEMLIICLAALFEIADPRLSHHWQCHLSEDGAFEIGPPSWLAAPAYHDRLSEGAPDIVADFKKWKSLLETEAMEPV